MSIKTLDDLLESSNTYLQFERLRRNGSDIGFVIHSIPAASKDYTLWSRLMKGERFLSLVQNSHRKKALLNGE